MTYVIWMLALRTAKTEDWPCSRIVRSTCARKRGRMLGPQRSASVPRILRLAGVLLLLFTTACIQIFRKRVDVELLDRPSGPAAQVVEAPVRAHMLDLSIVYFEDGLTATRDSLTGAGQWYSPTPP